MDIVLHGIHLKVVRTTGLARYYDRSTCVGMAKLGVAGRWEMWFNRRPVGWTLTLEYAEVMLEKAIAEWFQALKTEGSGR